MMEERQNPMHDFDEQLNSDLPIEVRDAILRIWNDLEEGITNGKAPINIGEFLGENINVIPSKYKGVCTPLLITFCYDKDKFSDRVLDCLDHAILICPRINKNIYFLTTQWDSKIVNDKAGYIESVRMNNVKITFIHISKKGTVVMPA